MSYHPPLLGIPARWTGTLTAPASWGAATNAAVTYYVIATDGSANSSSPAFGTGAYAVTYTCIP